MLTVRKDAILLFFCLLFLVGCAGRKEIVTGLPEKEANEIVVFLASKGLSAEKQQTATAGAGAAADTERRYSVLVPSNQAVEALAILNRHGLPRRPGPNLLNLFSKSGLVSSAQEEQIRFQEGLGEQIASVIRKIDGVVDSNVQISTPQAQDAFAGDGGETDPVRASVYVKHTGILDDPNSQLITKIKRLVAASVVGLDYDHVTVVSDRARYADIRLEGIPDGGLGDQRDWVQVWSVTIAKESVTRFRGLFFILCAVLLILALLLVWLLWKLFPLIQEAGGLGRLFSGFRPIHLPEKQEEEPEEEEHE